MSKEQEVIERLEYLEHVLGHTMIQAGEIIGKQGKYNLANDIKTVLNMLKEKDKEIDLMAEQLEGVPINKNISNFEQPNLKECITIFTNKEDVKQYFKSKAEKE